MTFHVHVRCVKVCRSVKPKAWPSSSFTCWMHVNVWYISIVFKAVICLSMSWALEAKTYGVRKQHYIVAHTVVKQPCKNILFGEKNINGGIDITSLYGDVGRNINIHHIPCKIHGDYMGATHVERARYHKMNSRFCSDGFFLLLECWQNVFKQLNYRKRRLQYAYTVLCTPLTSWCHSHRHICIAVSIWSVL